VDFVITGDNFPTDITVRAVIQPRVEKEAEPGV